MHATKSNAASRIRFPAPPEIPESMRVDASKLSMRWLVNGEIRVWNGPGNDVLSPVCVDRGGTLERHVIGRLPALDARASLEALAAAKTAWDGGRGAWPTAPVKTRIEALVKFVERMAATREDVVRLLMWEIAKTRKDAEVEFDRTVVYVRDTIEALKELDRSCGRFMVNEGYVGQARRSPLGVVLCMGPFNYPLNETYTTLIPALAMGNTVVSKLPKYGGLCQMPLLEAFRDSFPAGVVNIIQGDGATIVGPIMESGDVDSLAFIGSARVGNVLRRQHPRPNRCRVVAGFGAKNPAVILPDADLDAIVKECVAGALNFNGQRCTALKLFHVHESIAGDFAARMATAVAALKPGMPWEPGVSITPLPEEGKPEHLAEMIADAVGKGARVLNEGGGEIHGSFLTPAVVYAVKPGMQLHEVEQFGPVVPIAKYSDEREVDEQMKSSPYGQQMSIFGKDPRKIARFIDAHVNLVSRINVNTQCRRGPDTFPFTGRKDSAEGTLSVADALRAFSIRCVVATSANPANTELVTEIVTRRLSTFLSTDYVF